ncbi:unnamed protein product [Paramecium sonneborni]|uniref:Uncharacterized protein n=1 Tax=Paramecium sonneborni TaxID=65129 RepID=A0A8S1QAJ3_9CILI|nr:unnamed protein product [Paramecium sonneborni]
MVMIIQNVIFVVQQQRFDSIIQKRKIQQIGLNQKLDNILLKPDKSIKLDHLWLQDIFIKSMFQPKVKTSNE